MVCAAVCAAVPGRTHQGITCGSESIRSSRKSVGMRNHRTNLLVVFIVCTTLFLSTECKKKSKTPPPKAENEPQERDENDPKQAFLSYGNNPLHDAARDGKVELVRKILNRVPGVFTDVRFSKWEYDDPEDYPDYRDKNDVIHFAH